MASEPQHWVWVTGPDYYLGPDGEENPELDPNSDYATDNWWTCHRDTRRDDLVVLYRSTEAKDVKYLIRTTSDAYSLDDHPDAREKFRWGCDFEVIERFERGIPIAALHADPATAQWPALRAHFVRSAWAVPDEVWDRLLEMAGVNQGRVSKRVGDSRRRELKEIDIQRELLLSPEILTDRGMSFVRLASEVKCRKSGTADLVGYDKSDTPRVVVELKRGRAGRDAVAQVLGYRASLQMEFRPFRKVRAVLVAEALDEKARDLVDEDPRLRFVALDDLDLRCRNTRSGTSQAHTR